jgi:hypothetical protein
MGNEVIIGLAVDRLSSPPEEEEKIMKQSEFPSPKPRKVRKDG